MALSVLSIALMVVDARVSTLQPLRSHLSLVLTPIYSIADLPIRLWDGAYQQVSSRADLLAENAGLRAEALLIQRRLQKLATLTEQNVRLRELLNSSSLVDERVLVAELVGVDPNPYTQRVLINKGEHDGVFLGQPVLDAAGLMGQVVEVMPFNARVLLITDSSHSLPVQVNRNGLRAIATGGGNNEWLELRFVSDTADIRVDDILVSSGLGQRFPAGYPVGRVVSVEQDSAQPFAEVKVAPTAQLTRSRYMLLVFSAESGYGAPVPVLDEGSKLNDAAVQAVEDALGPLETVPAAPQQGPGEPASTAPPAVERNNAN